jgi:histidyl-tRNA synthetase
MFVNFGEKEEKYCMAIAGRFRDAGISAEIFPEAAKMKKQLEYASRKNIPFTAIIGEKEMSDGTIQLKNMATGEQQEMTEEEVKKILVNDN